MRRALTAALASVVSLVSLPAFGDVIPEEDETVQVACFVLFASTVLLAAVLLALRARRRR
jgi:hypothetical protein